MQPNEKRCGRHQDAVRRAALLALCCVAVSGRAARADESIVAVASNFAPAMREIVTAFEAQSAHTVKVAYGSSGKIYAQVRSGAPFEAFFSADQEKPAALEREGLIVPGSRFTYAVGALVLWSADAGVVDPNGEVLRQVRFDKLALANPDLAPYGAAAVALLRHLGVLEATRAKWVQGENISQAYLFVDRGGADLGLVALSQVWVRDELTHGSAWIIPPHMYPPIRQDMVLLAGGRESAATRALVDFVRSPAARAIIEAHGYRVEVEEGGVQ